MPVQPKPHRYTCTQCGWTRLVAPLSDALSLGFDCFQVCPACQAEVLEVTTATAAETLWCSLANKLNAIQVAGAVKRRG